MAAFGSVTALTAGAATLNGSTGQQYFWVQNNDAQPITLTFKNAGGSTLGQWVLNPATVAGRAGDTLDSVSMPAFLDAAIGGSVVLAGTGTGQFSSGASTRVPTIISQAPLSGVSGVRGN